MLETVMKHGIIFYVMGVMMGIGMITKVISYFTTRKLVRAAEDIQKSNQKLMRLVKAKFEHASMVSDKVQNVEAFVQKYLYEYEVFGVRLNTWKNFPIKMAWMIFAIGVFGVVANYRMSGMEEMTFRYGAFAAIYAVALISIHILSDEKTKMDATKNYMVEYLENVCIHRYEKANMALKAVAEESISEAEAEDTVELMETQEEVEREIQKIGEKERKDEREEQEIRIRAILQEFLA